MNGLYKEEQACMEFTNEEIISLLINPFKKKFEKTGIEYSKSEFLIKDNETYRSVQLQGENLEILFYGGQTSIFALDEEFMFIDESFKKKYVSSDTYGNVVYEGTLRDKTHEEIMEIIFQMSSLLISTKKIDIKETKVSQEGVQYPSSNYIVKMISATIEKHEMSFENIHFIINEN